MNDFHLNNYVKCSILSMGQVIPAENVGNCTKCDIAIIVTYSMTRTPLCPVCWDKMKAALAQVGGRGIHFG